MCLVTHWLSARQLGAVLERSTLTLSLRITLCCPATSRHGTRKVFERNMSITVLLDIFEVHDPLRAVLEDEVDVVGLCRNSERPLRETINLFVSWQLGNDRSRLETVTKLYWLVLDIR